MFDLNSLAEAVKTHGRVARLVVAAYEGSSPREVGASMLVWADGQSGTIGGGALEWQAILRARERLLQGQDQPHFITEPLGPKLGQCCGGAVSLVTEIFDAKQLAELTNSGLFARPITAEPTAELPFFLQRLISKNRKSTLPIPSQFTQGWMIEPMVQNRHPLWIWGAGHVGRALVDMLSPLPDFAITWVDVGPDRFPENTPAGVEKLWSQTPNFLAKHAPLEAQHLIVTFSHALDLELCHQLLNHGFTGVGLIGSHSKWARFCSRLVQLGHKRAQIDRIRCPIGDPALGKHPHQIAVGVAVELLKLKSETEIADDKRDDGGQCDAAAS